MAKPTELSAEEREREVEEETKRMLLSYQLEVAAVREAGWAEGFAEGRAEGLACVARAVAERLLASGMSPDDVFAMTGVRLGA